MKLENWRFVVGEESNMQLQILYNDVTLIATTCDFTQIHGIYHGMFARNLEHPVQ